MKIAAATVEEYLGALPEPRKQELTVIRDLVRRVAPDAEETISYGMPYYQLKGHLCAFASQKNYMSFYFMNTPVLEQHRAMLGDVDCGKGCIRFKRLAELPLAAIEFILGEAAKDNRTKGNEGC